MMMGAGCRTCKMIFHEWNWDRTDFGSISKATFSELGRSAELDANRISWKHSFHSMQVEFGHHDEQFEARPHGHLRRRQDSLDALDAAAPSSTTAPAVSGIALSSATVSSSVVGTLTNIAFPTVPDTSMPAATSVANDISYQITDTRILPSNESVLADAEGLVL